MIRINKTIIAVALIISIVAFVAAPLLQSTGMVAEPLAKEKIPKSSFLQQVIVYGGFLEFLNITKTLQT